MDRRNDTGHQDINDVVTDNAQHLLVRLQLCSFAVVGWLNEIIVLGGNYNRIDTDRIAVIIIFNGYLALGVRTQIRHHLSFHDGYPPALAGYGGQDPGRAAYSFPFR